MANRRIFHEMRQSIHLTELQKSIIVGTVLGDGTLSETFSKNNLRLQIEHCNAQKEYVFWKYEMLKNLILTPPTYKIQHRSWAFRTISHPEITAIGKQFYDGHIKVITKEIGTSLNTLGVAIWFMDDGCYDRRNKTYILNTQCYTIEGVELLRDMLRQKFKMKAVSIHKDKTGWRLYIQKESSERFKRIVKPFMLPSMAYKIGEPCRDYTLAPDVHRGEDIVRASW